MVLTRVKSGSVATKITTGGGASVSGIVAEAKAEVSRESVKEVSWDTPVVRPSPQRPSCAGC